MSTDKSNYSRDYLINKWKISPVAAAGIVGNLQAESNFNTKARGDGDTSYGIAQWHKERKNGLINFAKKQGKDYSNLDTQLDYLVYELNTTQKKAYNSLNKARTPEEAAIAFMNEFERPAEWAKKESVGRRTGFAQKVYGGTTTQGGSEKENTEYVIEDNSFFKDYIPPQESLTNNTELLDETDELPTKQFKSDLAKDRLTQQEKKEQLLQEVSQLYQEQPQQQSVEIQQQEDIDPSLYQVYNIEHPEYISPQFQQGGIVRGGTKAVQDYQKMLNEKYNAGLTEDGAWGRKTQGAYEKFIIGNDLKTKKEEAKSTPQIKKDEVFNPITGGNNTAQLQTLPKEVQQAKHQSGRLENLPNEKTTNVKQDPFNPITGSDNVGRLPQLQKEQVKKTVPEIFTFNPIDNTNTARIPTPPPSVKKGAPDSNFVFGSNPMNPYTNESKGFFNSITGKYEQPEVPKIKTIAKATNTKKVINKVEMVPESQQEGVLDNLAGKIDDGIEMAKNWWDRRQAKDDPNLKERTSSIKISDIKKPIITGDTIKDNERRYHLPEVIDLNANKFGTRNRGQNTLINTPGGVITSFEPFVDSKEYFSKTQDANNSSYIGVDAEGKIKVGQKKDFIDGEYKVSKTFSNKVVDINKDAKGNFVLDKSNPNASKHTLSPTISVLGEDGKIKNGKMNILLPKNGNSSKSYDVVTGGRYIMKTPDGTTKMVSGSLEDISKVFYSMKKNHPYVEMYTLDNGAYSRGIRTYDQKLTKDDLRSYDNQNSGGGNFAYLIPEQQEAISKSNQKFNDFESVALLNLKKLHPNKKVEIKFQNQGLYNDNGGRDFESQAGIKAKGNSQTDISLHNFDAARDYEIYVDGKKINPDKNKKLYKDVLWEAAKSSGLYHLEEWDVAHIGLAKEGQGSAFREIRDKYPDLLTKNKTSLKTIETLKKMDKKDLLDLINNTTPVPKMMAGLSDYDKNKLKTIYTEALKIYNK